MSRRKLNRRDHLSLVAGRAAQLTPASAAVAWNYLAGLLDTLADKDVPKYADLVAAIRAATITARAAESLHSDCNGAAATPQPASQASAESNFHPFQTFPREPEIADPASEPEKPSIPPSFQALSPS